MITDTYSLLFIYAYVYSVDNIFLLSAFLQNPRCSQIFSMENIILAHCVSDDLLFGKVKVELAVQ